MLWINHHSSGTVRVDAGIVAASSKPERLPGGARRADGGDEHRHDRGVEPSGPRSLLDACNARRSG